MFKQNFYYFKQKFRGIKRKEVSNFLSASLLGQWNMIQFCNLICGLKRNNFNLSLVGLQSKEDMQWLLLRTWRIQRHDVKDSKRKHSIIH